MKSGQLAAKQGEPPRRRQRDPEEAEDEDMSRNPRDWPFPNFQPSEAATLRKKNEATKAIKDMVHGLTPVVPFSKPELVYTRPPWCTSNVVVTRYEPQLDLLAQNAPRNEPTPPLVQPKWVTYIPRVVSGCPQLGLVMVNEPDASRRTPKRVRRSRKPIVQEPDPIEEAAKPRDVEQLARSLGTTPRFAPKSKDDITFELLRDKRVRDTIKREVVNSGRVEHSDSVLVSLPKIGVRLFAVDRGSKTAR